MCILIMCECVFCRGEGYGVEEIGDFVDFCLVFIFFLVFVFFGVFYKIFCR